MSDRALLRNVYWLGGSPCSGKSSVAEMVAERFGWRLYHCDDWYDTHRERATPHEHATLYRLSRLSGDALWLRPVAEQIQTAIDFCADEFALALDELRTLAREEERPILFEGAAALPHLVKPLLPDPTHAYWLLPTEPFQRYHYARRPWIHDVLGNTSDPALAFDNWMARDAGFARWLEEQVTEHGLSWSVVDGSMTIEETAARIERYFERGSPFWSGRAQPSRL